MNKAPRRKQRGINGTLQTAGFQPAFAPGKLGIEPEEIKDILIVPVVTCSIAGANAAAFDVTEKSIQELQTAQVNGIITAKQLVQQYLARIQAYDQAGPMLNSIIRLNRNALQEAEALDQERKATGPRGPLHGIPVLLKDNYQTKDMPTTGGSLALATFQPDEDAFQVKRLREAGAIILGKTAMHELAAGIINVSSLSGITRNPYALNRVPGGSSGGTAAAVAASFAAAGMGSDTCGSIRIPAANLNVVGLRVTRGLSSRFGVIPLSSTEDEAGPLARTVMDLAIMLDATVGSDPRDPVTANADKNIPDSYAQLIIGASLKGRKIGVINALVSQSEDDDEVATIIWRSFDEMKAQGAEIVEINVPELAELMRDGNIISHEFKFDLAEYLSRNSSTNVKNLQEIIDGGYEHYQLESVLRLRNIPKEKETEERRTVLQKQVLLSARVVEAMKAAQVDAIAYAVLRRKAARIGEPQAGFTCQLSSNSGLPAISVPGGFTSDDVPIGIELLGQPFQEAELLKIAFAWEQSSKLRRAPFSTPVLVDGKAPEPATFSLHSGAAEKGGEFGVDFVYDKTTSRLSYKASILGVKGDDVAALALHRGEDNKAGPVLAQLVRLGQIGGVAEVELSSKDRDALAKGQLYVKLYTRDQPQGGELQRLPAAQ